MGRQYSCALEVMNFFKWLLLIIGFVSFSNEASSQAISFVNATTNGSTTAVTNLNLNVPSGIQQNDLLLITVSWRNVAGTINTPAGWTSLYQATNSSMITAVFYRFATGSEPASYNLSKTSTAIQVAASMAAYRGVSLKSPFLENSAATGNTANLAAPSRTTTVANAWYVGLYNFRETGAFTLTEPVSMLERSNYQVGGTNNIGVMIADELIPTAGATGTRTVVSSTSDRWIAYSIALRPARVFYSYQSGPWSTTNTWTKDPSGTTLLNPEVPTANDSVVILNGRVVSLTANVTTTEIGITLESGGVLDISTFTLPDLSSLGGQGELRITRAASPAYFPVSDSYALNAAGGGTVTYYYTGADITLPTSITEFNNLKLTRETSGNVIYRLASNLTINGNLTIERTGTATVDLRIGNDATTRSLTVNGNIVVSASCSLTTHTAGAHTLAVAGDFINTGRVRFTNQTTADYLNPYNGGYVTVTFSGTSSTRLDCFGVTDFYRLVLDKGIDQTFVLTVNSSNVANFRLLGENDLANNPAQTTTNPNPVVLKALSLRNGTLRLKENISIPSLSEGGDDIWIPLNTCLWVDGATVSTTTTDNGTGYQAVTISGRLRVSGGTFTTSNAAGLIYIGDGIIDIEGGTTTVCQMWNVGAGRTTYRQSGGTCILNNIGETNNGNPVFKLESVDASFQMTGGNLIISNPTTSTYGGLDINVSPLNAIVTGGQVEFITTGTQNFNFRSTAPFYNLKVNRTGGTGNIQQLVNPLTILNDFEITGSQTYNTNNLNFAVGGDFTINTGSTFTPGTSTITFNGSTKQLFSSSGTITAGINNLTVSKSDTLELAGTNSTFLVLGNLSFSSGILADGGKTLELRSAITWNGVHTGSGKLLLSTASSRTISGNGNGVIRNIDLSGPGANTVYTLSANLKITGALQFITNGSFQRILDIQGFNLLLDTFSTVSNNSSVRFIRTSGFQSALGLTKVYNTNSFIFPIGTATDYTPASITFDTNPTTRGAITIRPVAFEHPSVTANVKSLTYYWRVTQNGFVLGSAKVSHQYTYAQADVVTGTGVTEDGYVVARFDVNSSGWVPGVATDVDETSNTATFSSSFFENTITGDYTAGDNSPDNPFGAVTIYYSRQNGNYNDVNTWSTVSHTVTSPPASIPNANSIVRIGDGSTVFHTITVSQNGAFSGSLIIGNGSVLDLQGFTGHNFGAIEGETVSGNGRLRIGFSSATFAFPAGDFGTFLGENGGEVEYYCATGQTATLPASIATYRNLTFSPQGTGQVFLSSANLTIYDTLKIAAASTATVFTYNINAVGGNLLIGKDLKVESGSFRIQNTGTARTIEINERLLVSNGATFAIQAGGTNTVHSIYVNRDITNNGTIDLYQAANIRADLTLRGSTAATFGGNTGGAATELANLIIDKGTSCATGVSLNVAGTLTTLTNNWLTLQNGYFDFSKSSSTLTLTNTATSFEISETACLKLSGASSTVWVGDIASDTADLILRGTLEVIAGTFNIGRTTNNSANDIEIAPAGLPRLEVSGGVLNVNGQIRRSLSSTAGALFYKQSGTSIVNVYGRNHRGSRGKIEVVNANAYFEMTGSPQLNVFRGGAVTFADLYVRPDSSFVDGGIVRLKPTGVGSTQNYRFDVTYSFWNLEIEGDGANLANVDLTVNNLNVNNELRILTNGTLNTNNLNVTVGAKIQRLGTYNAGINTTRINGNPSQIEGAMNGTNAFHNLVITSGANLTLQTSSPIRVNGTFTIESGATINDNSQEIDCKNNVINNGTHTSSSNSSTNTLVFSGTATQQISGTGTFGNVVINNVTNVNFLGAFTINRRLTLTVGLVDLGDRNLKIGIDGEILGTFGLSRMIRTNGVLSDGGLTKDYGSGAKNFLFPIGVGAKYTPARVNITSNPNTGSLTVKPINIKHPSTRDAAERQLNYYWQIDSTGFGGAITANISFLYNNADVSGTETNYRTGRFLFPNWVPTNGITGTVTPAGDSIFLSNVNYLSGGFTAGESTEFTAVSTYYSRNAACPGGCEWTTAASWSTDGHDGAAAANAPVGVPVIIATGHTVNVSSNSQLAESVRLNGTAILNMNQTFANNLGVVSGTGTLRIRATASQQFVFPGGNFVAFTADTGGTVEFYNAGNGILPTQTTYNKVVFKDASTRTQANVDWVINGDVTIEAGSIVNTSFNRNWEVRANWINQVGANGYIPGNGTVTFSKATGQTITGATVFYKLAIAGGGVKTLLNEVTVTNELILSNGLVYLGTNNLIMDSLASSGGSPSTSSMVVQNGSGRIRKNYRSNSGAFLFPIGEESTVTEYSPAILEFTSGAYGAGAFVTVQVIDDQNPSCSGNTNYLSRYWAFSSSGITSFTANVQGYYLNADVNGNESLITARMTRPSLPCLNGIPANTAGNFISITGSTVLNNFSGGEAPSPEPTISASLLVFENVAATTMRLRWTKGNGSRHLVLVKQGVAVDIDPVDNISYTASSVFGNGTQLGTGNYVLYNSSDSTFELTGLAPETTYHFAVFTFNNSGIDVDYKLTSPALGNQSTWALEPTSQASNIVFSSVGTTSITVKWTNGNGNRRLVLGRADSAVAVVPTDGSSYTANATFEAGSLIGTNTYVLFSSTLDSVVVSGLDQNRKYHFKVFEFNGTGGFQNYLIGSAPADSQHTYLLLDVQVWLEGAFNGSDMDADLIDSLPLKQPYNQSPWNFASNDSVLAVPNSNIVDWVYIQLRKADNASNANSSTIRASRVGFVLKNGAIVGLDGSSLLRFEPSEPGNFFVVVYHRTHIPVISNQAIVFSSGAFRHNFKDDLSKAFGTEPLANMGGGNYGLYAGRVENTTAFLIDEADRTASWNDRNNLGYRATDARLKGEIDASVRSIIWNNRTRVSYVP